MIHVAPLMAWEDHSVLCWFSTTVLVFDEELQYKPTAEAAGLKFKMC